VQLVDVWQFTERTHLVKQCYKIDCNSFFTFSPEVLQMNILTEIDFFEIYFREEWKSDA